MRKISAFLALLLSTMAVFAAPAKSAAAGNPALMYLAVWPHTILVIDSNQEKIVDKIDIPTDVARTLILSPDKKKIIASTLKDNSILVIDLQTKKIETNFSLIDGGENVRLTSITIDPTGKQLYAIATNISKKIDHFEVGEQHFAVVDLDAKKIVRTVEFSKEDAAAAGEGQRGVMKFSPDGKFLYRFGSAITIYDTTTLKQVKKIELSKAEEPETSGMSVSLVEDPNAPAGKVVGIFNSSDTFVHQRVFGIADIDLATQSYDMTPIGPAATNIQPMLMTPDRKTGYTVAVNGTHGNRVTEFWVFDLKTRKIINKKEFLGRTRLNFGMTADGTKLLIYNAGFQIEVYDAKTLTLRSTIELPGDTVSNLIVLPTQGR